MSSKASGKRRKVWSTKAEHAAGFSILTYSFQHRLPSTSFQARFLFREINAICACSEGRFYGKRQFDEPGTPATAGESCLLDAVVTARLAVVTF